MSDNKNMKFVKPNQDYMPEWDSSILNKDIEELGLSAYTLSKLKAVEINQVLDLCRCQMRHMYKIPGISKKNVFEVLKKLQVLGVDFKRSPVAATTIENDSADDNAVASKTNNANPPKNNNQNQTKNNKFKENKPNKSQENKANACEQKANKPNVDSNKNAIQAQKNKVNNNNKKVNENQQSNQKNNFACQKQNPQTQNQQNIEPKRLKVNSYELDAFINENISVKKTLKQEREEKIAKAIKDLPQLKNEDGLYKFYKHGKWGYKNEAGKVVIEPTYTEAFNFKEGLACVELNERCGFINKQGEVVIPIEYDTACSFSEGLASVTKDDKCGYIDKDGNIVFDFIYQAATSFENNIALVKKDGKWGYMDRATGEIRLR